jgi:hypothetical protein
MTQTQTVPETFLGVGYTRDRAGLPLEALRVPVPQPAADEVLIRVAASSLNPLECKLAEPNWAEKIQAIAGLATMVVAAGGICFVWWQMKQVERSIRSNTNERLTGESLEILRFLAEHPETYDYFYNGKEPTGDVDNMLKYATEMNPG